MYNKTAVDIVMEAVAMSDSISLIDMESIDIREKVVFNHEKNTDCIFCVAGLEHEEHNTSFMRDIINEANEKKIKASMLVEKIYNNPTACIESLFTLISIMSNDTLINVVKTRCDDDPLFKLKLILMLKMI